MYILCSDRGRYYRVKQNQTAREVERWLLTPVNCCVFAGEIIEVSKTRLKIYSAQAGDSYLSIAEKFNIEVERLKELNGGRAVYPTAKILVPDAADEMQPRGI